MIRPLRLADVAALLLFLGRSPVNEARARGRLGDKSWGLAAAAPVLQGCLVTHDAHLSYVCVNGGFIWGLACLQSCRGPHAWEMELLLLTQGHESCSLDLLEGLGSESEEIGRLFLRLSSGSGVLDAAKRAGFSEYATEALYRLEADRRAPKGPDAALRPKTGADDHNLFRLYNACVPVKVRSVAGMTLEEWRGNRDRGPVREYVQDGGGELTAWLRVRRDGRAGQFDMLVAPGSGDIGLLVDHALSLLSRSRPVYCLVPESQVQQPHALEERGFRRVGEYRCLSKELMARVRKPQLVPLSA
jgi:hypothetical protein